MKLILHVPETYIETVETSNLINLQNAPACEMNQILVESETLLKIDTIETMEKFGIKLHSFPSRVSWPRGGWLHPRWGLGLYDPPLGERCRFRVGINLTESYVTQRWNNPLNWKNKYTRLHRINYYSCSFIKVEYIQNKTDQNRENLQLSHACTVRILHVFGKVKRSVRTTIAPTSLRNLSVDCKPTTRP